MRPLAIAYFFTVTAAAGFAVGTAYRLQSKYRQPWLPAYTLYLAGWGALALVSVAQYVVSPAFLPRSVLPLLQIASSPLWATALAVSLYFLSSFIAQLAGRRLPRIYTGLYVALWSAAGLVIGLASLRTGESSRAAGAAASLVLFVLKTATIYGWIARGLLTVHRLDDEFERRGLQRFLLLFLAGCLAFDLAVRDATALLGLRMTDMGIGLVQVGMNYPALAWLAQFLRRRAVQRPAELPPADLKIHLAALGLSAREAEVIDLLASGLSQKEIGERLFIATETVKKHTYHAYRKLGVQNRVQLIYFIQNRASPPAGG